MFKQTISFIECCIISSVWIVSLLLADVLDTLPLLVKLLGGADVHVGLLEEAKIYYFLFVILSLVPGIIIYSVLKKKYEFETKVFFYGAGFTSCVFLLFLIFRGVLIHFLILRIIPSSHWIEFAVYAFSALSFTLFYYTYATLLQRDNEILFKNNKKIGKGTFYLAVLTVISYAVLIVFEIINYQIPFTIISLLFFGVYFVYCVNNKIRKVTLQELTWVILCVTYSAFVYFFFFSLISRPII
ncbi:MAG: hypothetical protein LBU81_02220 [Methanosarcinales archaeon]|jgi:hypothetical protein|nr:hypothetical protein [Methanosarcinales archaeon]